MASKPFQSRHISVSKIQYIGDNIYVFCCLESCSKCNYTATTFTDTSAMDRKGLLYMTKAPHIRYLWSDVWAGPVRACVGTWWILIVLKELLLHHIEWNIRPFGGKCPHSECIVHLSVVSASTWTIIAYNHSPVSYSELQIFSHIPLFLEEKTGPLSKTNYYINIQECELIKSRELLQWICLE